MSTQERGVRARQAIVAALEAAGIPPAAEGRPGPCIAWNQRTQVVEVWWGDGWTDTPEPANWHQAVADTLARAGYPRSSAGVLPAGMRCLMVEVPA